MADSASLPVDRAYAADARPAGPGVEPMQLPRAPVLGWSSFRFRRGVELDSVDALRHRCFTTSGRAALYHALRALDLPPGSHVLVPTYHCPTMVAPILCAGMQPRFFGIGADGLPDLRRIALDAGPPPRAMIVAHYFGLPQSLAAERRWCDEHGVALIEDCAHSYFGTAGDRPVGTWGDLATASASKFFPVPEAGVLASARRPLAAPALARRDAHAQLKGVVDVIELGSRYRRFGGLDGLLSAVFRWKNRRNPPSAAVVVAEPPPDIESMMQSCDMGRITLAPLWLSVQLARRLPRQQIVAQRRRNFARYLQHFGAAAGARPLWTELPAAAVPYVFPLWVEDADRVYHALRALGAPVFRWDHIWPTTPRLDGDHGRAWSRHVLQMLCHQDLDDEAVDRVARAVLALLDPAAAPKTTPLARRR